MIELSEGSGSTALGALSAVPSPPSSESPIEKLFSNFGSRFATN
jgi:hypothetical protein